MQDPWIVAEGGRGPGGGAEEGICLFFAAGRIALARRCGGGGNEGGRGLLTVLTVRLFLLAWVWPLISSWRTSSVDGVWLLRSSLSKEGGSAITKVAECYKDLALSLTRFEPLDWIEKIRLAQERLESGVICQRTYVSHKHTL